MMKTKINDLALGIIKESVMLDNIDSATSIKSSLLASVRPSNSLTLSIILSYLLYIKLFSGVCEFNSSCSVRKSN